MNKVELEFQVLNNKLEKLFERLSRFNNEQLNQKVIEGKWSINENIYHLIIAEKVTEKYIRTKTSYPETLVNVNILSRMKSFILESFLKLGVSYKGPAIVTENFPEDFDFDDVGDACDGLSLNETLKKRKLIRITDILGRDIQEDGKEKIRLYIYNDGGVERKIKLIK